MSDTKNIFDWDAGKYSIKVDAMDRQHQELIRLMNQLYQENGKGSSKTVLLQIASQLGAKTTEHFANEEKYFATIKDYTFAGAHKRIHADLLKRYQEQVDSFKKSSADKVPDEFFLFLKVWLSAHICGIDKKYGDLAHGH